MIFVNRDIELSWLLALYESRQKKSNYNVVIYGLRRVGKTTLLREFINKVDYGILLELAYVTSGRELIENVTKALTELAFKKKLIRVEYTYPKNAFEALRFLIEYPQAFASKNDVILAFCLDEFHILLERIATRISTTEKIRVNEALEKVFWFLKSAIPKTTNVFWVLSTSLSWHLLEKYTGRLSAKKAFLALFTTRRIEPLDEEASIKLIKKLSKTFNYEISEVLAKKIYEVTGGIPALIEIIISYIAPRYTNSIEALNSNLKKLVSSTELNDFFESMINFLDEISRHGKSMILRVLRSIAEGNISAKEIAEKERIDYNVAYNLLEELTESGFVIKQKIGRENVYQLKYPMMKAWLLSTKPYLDTRDKQRIGTALGILFDQYMKGLFEKAKELRRPLVLEERDGKYFNNTIEKLEIIPIYSVDIPKGSPQMQVDIIATGRLGKKEVCYIVENKYTMSPIFPKDVLKFADRVKAIIAQKKISDYKAIMVQGGEGGYHPASIATAMKNEIITITKIGLTQLAKRLNYPKII